MAVLLEKEVQTSPYLSRILWAVFLHGERAPEVEQKHAPPAIKLVEATVPYNLTLTDIAIKMIRDLQKKETRGEPQQVQYPLNDSGLILEIANSVNQNQWIFDIRSPNTNRPREKYREGLQDMEVSPVYKILIEKIFKIIHEHKLPVIPKIENPFERKAKVPDDHPLLESLTLLLIHIALLSQRLPQSETLITGSSDVTTVEPPFANLTRLLMLRHLAALDLAQHLLEPAVTSFPLDTAGKFRLKIDKSSKGYPFSIESYTDAYPVATQELRKLFEKRVRD